MKKGFSLIELLIVIAIMGTLTGGTIIAFGDTAEHAIESTRLHNRQTIRRAIDGFKADCGRYPNSLGELVEARYLREVPLDPSTKSSDTWVTIPSTVGGSDVWDVRWLDEQKTASL